MGSENTFTACVLSVEDLFNVRFPRDPDWGVLNLLPLNIICLQILFYESDGIQWYKKKKNPTFFSPLK